MKLRPIILEAALLAGLCAGPFVSPAPADPIVRVSWDQCDPIIANKEWAGPGIYRIVVSATNLPPLSGQGMYALVKPVAPDPFPDAWNFDGRGTGCQIPGLFQGTTAGFSKACPALSTFGSIIAGMAYPNPEGSPENTARIFLGNAFSPLNPNPAIRYTLWQITFDHSNSVAGPSEPPKSCGGIDRPVCFEFYGAAYLPPEGGETPMVFESRFLYWNGSKGAEGCPGAVPVQAVTWGTIKAQYR